MPISPVSIPVRVEGHVTYAQAATILGVSVAKVVMLVNLGLLQRYNVEGFARCNLLGESEVIAYRETVMRGQRPQDR